jgi:ABC-type glycerol-3-phosphate transport system substrate-binding protein
MKEAVAESPLVQVVRGKFLRELSSGRYPLNEPLPTHRQWAKRFRVSTATVRRALELLKVERIIESAEGSYTFLRAVPSPSLLERQQAKDALPIRVSFWAHDRKDFSKMRQAIVRHRFQQEFRKTHPQVEFDEQQIERRSNEVQTMLVQSVMNGSEPTLAGFTQTCLPFLHDHGAIAPVTRDVAAGSKRELEAYLARLKPRYLRACSRHGNLLLLPDSATHTLLLYNKDFFRRARLDPNRPPRDWEELRNFAQIISRAHDGQPSLHLAGTSGLATWLMHLTYQALPRLDGETLPAVDWASNAAKQAIEYFVDLYSTRKLLAMHVRDQNTFFARNLSGEFAMQVMEFGSIAHIVMLGRTDQFGIAPIPEGPNGRAVSLANCGGWGVNAHATREQQQATLVYALAWERWLHEGDGGALMKRLGVAPSLWSLIADRAADRFTAQLPADWLRTIEQIEASSQWEAPEADWKKLTLGRALEEMLHEGQTLSVRRMMELFSLQEKEAGFGQPIPEIIGELQ